MEEITQKGKERYRLVAFAVFVVIAVGVPVVTYLAVSHRGRIPPAPRVVFTEEEMQRSILDLVTRIKSFKPTDQENALIEDLQEVHMEETSSEADPNSAIDLRQMMKRLEASLQTAAKANEVGSK